MKSNGNWFTRVPGIVTSLTATVTALAGLYAVLVQTEIIPNIFASREKEAQEEETQAEAPPTDGSSSWTEGNRALAHRSDQYWYLATVREADPTQHRYLVEFGDGSSDWIVASQMLPDDIIVGDRISAYWKQEGTYYWGKITKRNGDDIHISYDDGSEEDTKIDVVRVVRPRTE
jgi:hypothetical protein